jgi:fructokinase
MRIGIDLGGTKIAAVAIDGAGHDRARTRLATPRDYGQTLDAVSRIVAALEHEAGSPATGVGISLPGVVDGPGGRVRAVNLPWLDERPLAGDLEATLGRPVRLANDANCFVLSEAMDGAAAGAAVVFGIVLGTGAGGGLVVDGRIVAGANALSGEWGHTPLPWRCDDDGPPRLCGCGRLGCVETVLCGEGLARLYALVSGGAPLAPPDIVRRAAMGEAAAVETLARHADALARALAVIIAIVDPDIIVVGGGLSGLPDLTEMVTARWGAHALVAAPRTRLVKARHGGDSGVRGAAWLWPGPKAC